jgi:hypothetical protein
MLKNLSLTILIVGMYCMVYSVRFEMPSKEHNILSFIFQVNYLVFYGLILTVLNCVDL